VASRPFDRSNPCTAKGQLRASKKCFEPDWDDRFSAVGRQGGRPPMSEVGHNDIDFPPNQLLNCSCNTLRLIADMALSRRWPRLRYIEVLRHEGTASRPIVG